MRAWPGVLLVGGPDLPAFFGRLNPNGRLFAAAVDGGVRPVVHERLPLEQAVLAHQKMDAGEVFGRIVLTPGRS